MIPINIYDYRYIAESTTLGPIIGIDHITTFFEASFLPIRWIKPDLEFAIITVQVDLHSLHT